MPCLSLICLRWNCCHFSDQFGRALSFVQVNTHENQADQERKRGIQSGCLPAQPAQNPLCELMSHKEEGVLTNNHIKEFFSFSS